MERNGDVVAEFNNCHAENFQLNLSPFETEYNIMCKDDNSESLFCKMSGKMRSDNIMDNEFRAQAEVSISDLKNQCLGKLSRTETDFVKCDGRMLSIIKKKTEDAVNNCLLPMFGKTSELCDFPSNPSVLSEDSFINGEKVLNDAKSTFNNDNSYTNSSAIYTSDSSLSATSPDSLLQPSGEDLSSSSIEEIFCPVSCDLNDLKKQYLVQHESKSALETALVSKETSIVSRQKRCLLQTSPNSSGIPKLDHKEEFEACPKNDLVMPELIPTICLDDDDSIPFQEKKSCEVVNVADSPEMPKLVPFSTDVEEIIKIKKERLDDNEPHNSCIVQLETAKRMLFFEKTIVSSNHAKQSKSENAELQCFTEFRSPPKILPCEIEHLGGGTKVKSRGSQSEDSLSSESGTRNFVEASIHNKDIWRSENSESRISFSGIHQHIKESKSTKHLNLDTNYMSEDNESQDSDNNPDQPKVILRKLSLDHCLSLNSSDKPEISVIDGVENESKFSFKHCLPSNDSDDNDSLASRPECQENKNSSNESPEIEEIEGMRFFQFHTKHAMEEFNKKPLDLEMDVEMIVPTKTTDITQIKGWRNKYFAPESQFQNYCQKNESSIDESSQNAVSLPPLEEQVDNQCLDFHSRENAVESSPGKETNCSENLKAFERNNESVSEANKTPAKTLPGENAQPSTIELLEKKASGNTVLKNPMSAFVSKELDEFLLNSSTLNVNHLQKVNPNIIPIAPDASILSIGKLSKNDKDWNVYDRRKFFYKVKDEHKDSAPADDKTDDSSSPVIILSSSIDSSSDDDIPVAKLSRKSNRVTSRLNRPIPNKRTKRSISDSSTDQTAQRLVLRLTKESKGASEGYKVSDISHEKEESSSSSSSSTSSPSTSESEELPDAFKKSSDGSLPIIKDTIFLKDTEPKLLEEFLNNLNMYGTSKDVAMLVESNQSYFVKGPVLTAEHCSDALDALISNKEFLDSKSKSTPKKKLKAWQKYLPKKLSKAQQQQISNKSSHQQKSNFVKLTSKYSEKTLNVKENFKQAKREEQQAYSKSPQQLKMPNSKEKIKQPKSDGLGKISKLNINPKTKLESPQKVLNINRNLKSKHVALEKNAKIKRKSKLCIDASAQLALIERGKRSIRLPARYLDSAVLAAGSEWVSPIFIEDDKKSRKQLLDVLGKMTPTTETDTHSEETRTENNLTSPKQLMKNKSAEGLVKSMKRPLKGSVNSKRLKVDHIQENTKLTKVVKSQATSPNLNLQSNKNTSSDGSIYYLPSCPCTPCSRTSSFQRKKKLFVCLTDHYKKRNDIDCETVDQNSEIVKKIAGRDESKIREPERKNSVMEKKSTLPPDNVTPRKTNFVENLVTECNFSKSANLTVPVSLNTSFTSSSTTTNVVSENYRSQSSSLSKTIISSPPLQVINSTNNNSNLLLPPMYDKDLIVSNEIFSNGQLLNVTSGGVGNKVILFVPPPVHNAPKNTKVPMTSNPLSFQTSQNVSSENRSKPPILARKATEIPTKATISESPKLISFSEYNSIISPKNILVPAVSPAVANSNSFNSSRMLLKLPRVVENTDKCLPLLYGSPQLNPVTSVPVLDSTPDNSNIISSPCSSQQKVPLMKAFKFGDKVYLYSPETNCSLNNSSYASVSNGIVSNQCNSTILTVQASEIPNSTNCSPILLQYPSVLKTGALSNSNGSENHLSANVKDASDVHKSCSELPYDHHSYHKKQSSERRRKSPLSKRKFKDDSESEVDVDTVDQDFDATLELKKQRFMGSDSDISDDECAKIFSSTVTGVINANKTKTVNERKRRLLIKTMFDKLKSSSSYFKKANSFQDILGMATYVVREFERKHEAYVKAKRILQLRNAQLLKKMNDVLQGVKDVKIRNMLKKQMIQTLALDWEKHRQNRSCVLSPLRTKNACASSEAETNQSHVPPTNDKPKEKDVIVAQLDIEVEESPKVNAECESSMDFQISEVCKQSLVNSQVVKLPQFSCSSPVQHGTGENIAEHHVMDMDVVEQPHVQLRILEAPPNGDEIETSLQTDDKLTNSEGTIPGNSCVEASTSVPRAAKRLHLKGSCDATTSDDDHLIIDLSDDSTNPEDKSLPSEDAHLQKSPNINHSTPTQAVGEELAMRKFPGLIPLFASNFYDNNELEIVRPKLISRTKSLDEGVVQNDSDCGVNQKIVAKRTSISGLMSLQPVEDESSELPGNQQNPLDTSDLQASESRLNSELSASSKLLDSSEVQKLPLKNSETSLSFGAGSSLPNTPPSANSDVPRHSMHRTCNDVRILHGVGPTYQDSSDVPDIKCKLSVPEEIVIDDSDDEVVEIDEYSQNRASPSSAGSSHHDMGGVNSKQESQVLALNL